MRGELVLWLRELLSAYVDGKVKVEGVYVLCCVLHPVKKVGGRT